jgi:MSHA biogenesis protein MshK
MSPKNFAAALSAACSLAMAGAQAQVPSALADPMRPPSAGAFGNAQEDAPAGRQLQSVLLSGGRKLAIIDGTMVPLGGMVGEARVVAISENAVTLKTGAEVEVLKMYPSVEKQPVKRASSRARDAAQGQPRHGGSR